jgi:hypothetical protein
MSTSDLDNIQFLQIIILLFKVGLNKFSKDNDALK